jgi:hypothetical protein
MITREDVKACATEPLTEQQIDSVIRIVENNEYLMQTINECIVDAIDDLPYLNNETSSRKSNT